MQVKKVEPHKISNWTYKGRKQRISSEALIQSMAVIRLWHHLSLSLVHEMADSDTATPAINAYV